MPKQVQVSGAQSLVERIASVLRDRVMLGTLRPGTPIRQDHVAAEFGASHVPVREAFRLLEAEGLLVAAPRKGVRVTALDPAAVVELTAMRAALETLALRHAAPKLTDSDYSEAERAIAVCARTRNIAVWEAANRKFHLALTAACGMPRLMSAIQELQRAASRCLFTAWRDLDWQPRSDDDHTAILKLLKVGDVDAAVTMLAQHIMDAGNALERALAAESTPEDGRSNQRDRKEPAGAKTRANKAR